MRYKYREMKAWLPLVLCLILLPLVALSCGPSPARESSSVWGGTTGMCPNCGSTSIDVESHIERSTYDGEPVEVLTLTCRSCGHSWTAPGGLK